MDIQKVSTAHISPNFKGENKAPETKKTSEEKFEDADKKKIALTLAGLAAAGAAIVGIAIKVKKGKGSEAIDEGKKIIDDLGKKGEEVTQKVVDDLGKKGEEVTQKVIQNVKPDAQTQAAHAIKKLESGTPLSTVKKEATKNYPKKEKKLINEALGQAQKETEAAKKAQKEIGKTNSQRIEELASNTQNLQKKANTASTPEEIKTLQIENKRATNEVKKRLQKQQTTTPSTHKKRVQLKRDENNALKAQKNLEKNSEKLGKKAKEIEEQTQKRVAAKEEFLNRTTPEQRAAEQLKQQQQNEKAGLRKMNEKLNQPKYQKLTQEYLKKDDKFLKKVVTDTTGRYDKYEKEIAARTLSSRVNIRKNNSN